jgi:hypothetical protein
MYRKFRLFVIVLLTAVLGVGCGGGKDQRVIKKEEISSVLKSAEVKAKREALVKAVKALRLPGKGEGQMIDLFDKFFEQLQQEEFSKDMKKEELNSLILKTHQTCQFLKDARPEVALVLKNMQSSILSTDTLHEYIDVCNRAIKTPKVKKILYFAPLLTAMLGGEWTSDEATREPAESVKSCFKSVDAVLDIHDVCTDIFSEILARLESIKDRHFAL